MEFDFQEFCLGLRGLTEEEAGNEVRKKRQRLANERSVGNLSEIEKTLHEDWDDQLKKLYNKINDGSKEMFKLDEVIKRDV